jgi:hypothetical protein
LDKTIVTAFLIVAGVISAVVAFNSIYPAIVQGSDAMSAMERRVDERMKTQIKIINAAQSGNTVVIWVKNVGNLRVLAPESSDLFFGPQGNYARLPYGGGNGSWLYVVENGTDWNPSGTIRIVVSYASPPGAGTYFIKMVLTNGVSDEYLVSW